MDNWLVEKEANMKGDRTGVTEKSSTLRETRRTITRLNADKIPAKSCIIIPSSPSACAVNTSSSLISVLSFEGSLLLS